MIKWEFAWPDSALIILDKWPSYRGGCLNIFDCKVIGWALLGGGLQKQSSKDQKVLKKKQFYYFTMTLCLKWRRFTFLNP